MNFVLYYCGNLFFMLLWILDKDKQCLVLKQRNNIFNFPLESGSEEEKETEINKRAPSPEPGNHNIWNLYYRQCVSLQPFVAYRSRRD